MPKEGYVTGNLYKMSGQLAEATKKVSEAPEDAPPDAEGVAPESVSPEEKPATAPRSPEMESALRSRHEEYVRLRRDMMSRLAASLSSLPQEASHCRKRIEELDEAEKKLKDILRTVEDAEEPKTGDPAYMSKLAEVMRRIENSRLETIRIVSRMERGCTPQRGSAAHAPHATHGALLHELESLRFKPLFKLGLYVGLPLGLLIFFAGLLVALAIIASLRVGI